MITMLMTDILQKYAMQQPNGIATVYDGTKLSYSEFYKSADTFAAYLQEQGFKKMM